MNTSVPALSSAELRAVDRRALAEYGLAGCVLMENAGAGAARLVLAARAAWGLETGSVAVCCGSGNNGGDGAVLARHLANAGVAVELFYTVAAGALRGDAQLQHTTVARMGLTLAHAPSLAVLRAGLARASVLVDALLGTGATGAPRAELAEWIRALNERREEGARTVALDLPSGFDADSGHAAEPTVIADLTATFAAPKLGFAQPGASRWLGRVELVDIGVPRALLHGARTES
jgi:NAD(P)H-hydrate epimerase